MKHLIYIFLFSLFTIPNTVFAQHQIQVLSAVVKDKKIDGAQVLLQKNGAQTAVSYTNTNGYATLNTDFTIDNNTIIIIKKDGYSTLVAKCPCEGLTYALSPIMENLDGARIVLTWGEFPRDLDSHLWYQNNHIFWDNKMTGHKSNLDVDDIDSYGPETITISERKFGIDYYYAVHDFTNRDAENSNSLSKSGATVFVYIGQSLVRTFYVPKNKIGNLWTVFKINGSGQIEDINSMTTIHQESINLQPSTSNALGSLTTVNQTEAKKLNNQGTLAYQKKDYEAAIFYYKAAIEVDPDYAQAYGNLGLTFQKTGQLAEALWANRKSVSLATSNSTRAGANYNIGKIYETKGEYQKAKQYYQEAKNNVDKPVYDEAIERMHNLLK